MLKGLLFELLWAISIYTIMSYNLKNTCATYQCAMIVIFHILLDDCLGFYVDDIVMKSREVCHNINDLRKVFADNIL